MKLITIYAVAALTTSGCTTTVFTGEWKNSHLKTQQELRETSSRNLILDSINLYGRQRNPEVLDELERRGEITKIDRRAIEGRRVLPGMSNYLVKYIYGEPVSVNRHTTRWGEEIQYVYEYFPGSTNKRYVYTSNGVITSVTD